MKNETPLPARIKRNIIIDPGHVGGEFFDLRTISVGPHTVREGDITFKWAELVALRLRERGHQVRLTRKKGVPAQIADPAYIARRKAELLADIGADGILKRFRAPTRFFENLSTETLVHAAIQNEADLLARASEANASGADLFLSLHLNGDPENLITSKNGVCGFTNHASAPQYPLFEKIIRRLAQVLDLPLYVMPGLEQINEDLYLDETLTLMKNVQIPILLLEGPFQNNESEAMRLYGCDDSRIAVMAGAVVDGLCEA